MSRRTIQQCEKGELYAIEWPEWHVDCAHEDCEESVCVSGLGEANDASRSNQGNKRLPAFGDVGETEWSLVLS